MPFTPIVFDESVGQTEASRPRVPEGYYLLRADKAEPTAEDYEKTPGVIFTYTILEGAAGVGRQMPDYNGLGQPKNGRGTQFSLGRTLGALGEGAIAKALVGRTINTWPELAALAKGISQRVAGKTCVGLIADQPGNNGRSFSGIEELLPADEWATMKTAAAPTAAPRPAATNGTAAAAVPIGALPDELAAMFANQA